MTEIFVDSRFILLILGVIFLTIIAIVSVYALTNSWLWRFSEETTIMTMIITILTTLTIGLITISTTIDNTNKMVKDYGIDNIIVQNYNVEINHNKSLDKDDLILKFRNVKDPIYNKNKYLSFLRKLKEQTSFIVKEQTDDKIVLQNENGTIIEVTNARYPRLWESLQKVLNKR